MPPLKTLCARFAPELLHDRHANALSLCDAENFQDRVLWVDGMDQASWPNWRQFMSDYAHASRDTPVLGRTLLMVVLAGTPPGKAPEHDVTLSVHDWRGIVDRTDILIHADRELRDRRRPSGERELLAATISRVIAWDIEAANRLLAEPREVVLNPKQCLRAIAHEYSWTQDTPADWTLGTDDGSGVVHAALAAIQEPARELELRIWSAQAAVVLPAVEAARHAIVSRNLHLLPRSIQTDYGPVDDPYAFEIGVLAFLMDRQGFDKPLRTRVRALRNARNNLAHLCPLPGSIALSLVADT